MLWLKTFHISLLFYSKIFQKLFWLPIPNSKDFLIGHTWERWWWKYHKNPVYPIILLWGTRMIEFLASHHSPTPVVCQKGNSSYQTQEVDTLRREFSHAVCHGLCESGDLPGNFSQFVKGPTRRSAPSLQFLISARIGSRASPWHSCWRIEFCLPAMPGESGCWDAATNWGLSTWGQPLSMYYLL